MMCKNCQYWDQEEGTTWGICRVEWRDEERVSPFLTPNHEDPAMALDLTGYGSLMTTATFSCILYTALQP